MSAEPNVSDAYRYPITTIAGNHCLESMVWNRLAHGVRVKIP
ncbi:hypothetical protein [Vibrio vulnificus]|nr:hypothetical protein [Vibrio vulnificus]